MDPSSQNPDKMASYCSLQPSSIVHHRLALELECEIFACLKLPIQRKFISGLGKQIYELCGPKIRTILKAKKLFNPEQNGWNRSTVPRQVTFSPDGLTAINSPTSHVHSIFAKEAFSVASPIDCRLELDNFPGTIIYYFEIDKLCFVPIRELADWFRALSLEIASIRATIRQNAFAQLRSLVKRWWNCPEKEKSNWEVRNHYKMELRRIMTELNPFYLAISRVMGKVYDIEMRLDQEEEFLCRFQLSYTTHGQINRLRLAHISSALGLAQAELRHWRHEDVPRLCEMLYGFGSLLNREFPNELKFCYDEIHSFTQKVMICESILDITLLQYSAKYNSI